MQVEDAASQLKRPPRWKDGLYIFLLCAAGYLLAGFALMRTLPHALTDFKGPYYGARCLIHRADPYQAGTIWRMYGFEGHLTVPGYPVLEKVAQTYMYPPTALLVWAPFALLPFSFAAALWTLISGLSLIAVAYLLWRSTSKTTPVASALLAGFMLINSVWLLLVGNPAGLSISLCIFSAWTLMERRNQRMGVLAMAVSLILKPQIGGFVWLYFLLAKGPARKRALQSLAVVFLLALPSVLWTYSVAPHWMSEFRANIAADSAPGAPSDPSPEANVGKDLDTVVDMQSIVSIFDREPGVYNPVSYGFIGALLLVWMLFSLRSQSDTSQAWIALAAACALTPLFAYHREHDTKLLLLCIPACITLWAARGALGWVAMALTSATIALNGDLTQIARIMLIEPLVSYRPGFFANVTAVLLGRPAQLSLLLLGSFYLWVLIRQVMHGTTATDKLRKTARAS